MTTLCWVCTAITRPFWANAAFSVSECSGCGHLQAEHRISEQAAATDYHRNYEQDRFVASLAVTRRRQAATLLDELRGLTATQSLFDFGCGRGWFLEAAKQRGLHELAGGDVSELALQLLGEQGIKAVSLSESDPLEKLDLQELGFTPEVITFLDVVEHFEGNLTAKFSRWLARLPAGVRFIVFKVPIREGLLFSMANLARQVGVEGLGKQLFQSGTYPPHYQYFTQRSLEAFVTGLGLAQVRVLDDLDFEPEELKNRLSTSPWLLRSLALPAGRLLAGAARGLERLDSRIVIAERR